MHKIRKILSFARMTPPFISCDCERSGAPQSLKVRFLDSRVALLLAMTCLFFSASLHAQEKDLADILSESMAKEAGYYAPEFCDFEITFPEKPVVSRRCPESGTACYQLHGYRYVYSLESSIDITAHCAPSTPKNYERYTEGVIAAALKGMRNRANIDNADINTQEIEGPKVRQGSLLGTGTYGKQDHIYNAQIWVGENSILTVEAKLIGQSNTEAEENFSEILASIKVKD